MTCRAQFTSVLAVLAAVAAGPVASARATATAHLTRISPSGDLTLTGTADFTSTFSTTCTSTITLTLTADGTGTITNISFSTCPYLGIALCTTTVTSGASTTLSLAADTAATTPGTTQQTTAPATDSATLTFDDALALRISCPGVVCTLEAAPGTISFDLTDGGASSTFGLDERLRSSTTATGTCATETQSTSGGTGTTDVCSGDTGEPIGTAMLWTGTLLPATAVTFTVV